jgi:hypothetical protein
MNRRQIALAVLFMVSVLLCPDQSRSVLSQGKSEPVSKSKRLIISSNEALALITLRHLAEAEYTFQSTVGRGRDFGSLEELAAARLIDAELAGGSKRGYSYKLIVTRATAAGPSLFEVIASPLDYGTTGVRSFSMDYQVIIHDSYVKNASVSDMQPIVHECGTIECTEAAAVWIMRLLSNAEAAYQSTVGRGRLYGTLQQMRDHQLIGEVLADGIKDGYLFRVRTDPGSPTEAPSFEVTAVPMEYGVTGRWSFYIDETYVLRGGDKGGAEASSNDPEYYCIR